MFLKANPYLSMFDFLIWNSLNIYESQKELGHHIYLLPAFPHASGFYACERVSDSKYKNSSPCASNVKDFSTSTLLMFGADNCCGGSPVHCRPYPLDASSIPTPASCEGQNMPLDITKQSLGNNPPAPHNTP